MQKKKFYNKNQKFRNFRKRGNRINHEIRASRVRLVSSSGSEEISLAQAMDRAKKLNLDLVEIATNKDVPIVKIIDYGKYKFEKAKKEREQKKKAHTVHVKEIKIGPKIDTGDFERKCKDIITFINAGDSVKVSMRFRGREIVHIKLGEEKMISIQEKLSDYVAIDKPLKREGRLLTMTFVKSKKKKLPEEKETKESIEQN